RAGEADDAGLGYGSGVRFWVEPERRAEFGRVSEARRAAWVWRRYVTAARASSAFELRYEELATDPAGVGAQLARYLEAPNRPLTEALRAVHSSSIGRWRRELTPEQVADVEEEAGPLLLELAVRMTLAGRVP
ncbi:MAG: sulfotransferase, partial [Deltaproteobacteria bacterium]|nr:sulfotransferase [Deltaproteobacteria bacterium]